MSRGSEGRHGYHGPYAAASDLFSPGSQPYVAGARPAGRRQLEKTRVLGIERCAVAGCSRLSMDHSKPIFASSPPAHAIRFATSAPNGPRLTPCAHWAIMFHPAGTHRHSVSREPGGYIWVFPRCGHLSVGICGKGEPAQSLRARLERYMDERGLPIRARPSTVTCCRRSRVSAGERIVWRATAGWRLAMPEAWWIR